MNGRADVVYGTKPGPEHCSDVGPASKGGGAVTASWPLSDTLTLGALPTAVASARAHARALIGDWGMADVAEDVELVVSELVTNAVVASTEVDGRPNYAYAGGGLPVVHLRLWSDHVHIVIEVWDQSPRVPEATRPEPDAESGRGLLLVEALCERWGWEHVPEWPGKVVWTEIQRQRTCGAVFEAPDSLEGPSNNY
jgi:anti-sigma regulatory factor (Ser/Thr protein kinase)